MAKRKGTNSSSKSQAKVAKIEATSAEEESKEIVEEKVEEKTPKSAKKSKAGSKKTALKKAASEPTDVKEEGIPEDKFTKADWCGPTSKNFDLKLVSWNINGLRAFLKSDSQKYLTETCPDIMGVQETKCSNEKIPSEIKNLGYQVTFSSADKEGYAGTGVFSKEKPLNVVEGIREKKHNEEGRVITAEFDKFFFVTAYVPNSGRGLPRLPYRQNEWDPDFAAYIKSLDEKKPVIVCGDLNVAHTTIDLANPKSNKRTAGFTQEERDGFAALLEKCDLVDSFRHFYPGARGAYSFWTYMGNARGKNVGWRLDYFLVSKRFMKNVVDSRIEQDRMGSDHCPISLYLKF